MDYRRNTLKILFVVKDYYFNGGGERMLVNLANALSVENQIEVLTFDTKRGDSIYELNNKVRIVEAGINKRRINFFTKLDYYYYMRTHIEYLNQFDFVISVGIISNLVLCMVCKKIMARCIAWEHFSYDGTPLYQRVLRKLWFGKLDHVIVLTKQDVEKYKKINPNTSVIYNFTYMKYRRKHEDNKQFLFIGRLSKQKGIIYLKQIISQFCEINSEWTFRIIGKGALQEDFLSYIKENNLVDRISYIEESDDIQYELEKSSCILMTSTGEGLPMVLIEAQTCGVPAISFDTITGPGEIISDGRNGFLVECYNVNLFVSRMHEFVNNERVRDSFSALCKLDSKRFEMEVIVKEWMDLLGLYR